MSAAAPPPPPHITPVGATKEYSITRIPAASSDGAGGVRPRKPFPHLQDLVRISNERIDLTASIDYLVKQAGLLVKQARSSVELMRPDQAYSEYLAAYTLVAYTIPIQHRDSLNLQSRPQLYTTYKGILKEVNALESTFNGIKDIIVEDNRRSGVVSTNIVLRNGRTSEIQAIPPIKPNEVVPAVKNPLVPSNIRPQNQSADHVEGSPGLSKYKPQVQPKPQSLLGSVLSPQRQRHNGQPAASRADPLSARFAQLRTADTGSVSPRLSQSSSDNDNSIQATGNPLDAFLPKTDLNSISANNHAFPKVPIGINGASRSPQISSNSGFGRELPQLPSPTYNPGRNMQEPSSLSSLRSIRDSTLSQPESSSSFTSVGSLTYATSERTNIGGAGPATSVYSRRPVGQPRRSSLNVPRETEITPAKLYDYLTTYNILLVDVRSRGDFESGHIPHANAICIEPAALRPNMSAEQLQDALVVSDENEQSLFKSRDQFDLVVYFDQSSRSTDFLSNPVSPKTNLFLRYLHDALHQYNHERPLLYPPVFMKGGIDAWVELRGEQALVGSNIAPRTMGGKPGRPIARRPLITSESSRLTIQKRKLRDYNPLGPEEEEKWRERARSETVGLDSQPQVSAHLEEEHEPPNPHFVRNVEDFFQSFPDIDTFERQSMTVPTPRVPNYPAPPAPLYKPPQHPDHAAPSIPAVPSRPAPIVQRPSYSGVSDRSVSQTLQSARAPQLAPYIPPILKRIPRTGLHNFGATCYMNATIQCLSATIPMTAFFLEGGFMKSIQKDNWKGSKGIMPELFTNLLRNLWQPNGVDTLRPTNFRKMCARLNKEWGSDRQQDANEFLGFLVDVLHEDLNTNWSRNPLRPLTTAQEAEREATPALIASKTEWARYEHRDHSRLTDLFAGQHISRLQCTTCRNSSTTYEPFYSISVEIPSSPRPVTLDDCLRSYCASETLSGDEVWRCPHCQTSREATKKILISRAPEFLVIHFKRFSASLGERARKIHTPVDFPLTGLMLDPYMLPAAPTAADHEIPKSMQRPARYDAYAVMRHLGASMGSGHYIGLVKDAARGCWREFNDEKITDFRPEELPWERRLQNEMAYLVFYQRVP